MPAELVLRLSHVLERLTVLHRGLIDLLQEEYGHMAELQTKGLIEAAHAKEAYLTQIAETEALRQRCVAEIEHFAGRPMRSLSEIALFVNLSDRPLLEAAGKVLVELYKRAKDLNIRNMAIAESSLERIEHMKRNVLGLTNTANENYSATGNMQPLAEQGGRLLSTEA